MNIDNIALLKRIPTPLFGEGKTLAKQRRDSDMDEPPAMERLECFVEYDRTQEQRSIQLFPGKGLAASLGEPSDYDNFKVIQLS
jgi:hypothetical protein